MKDGTHFSPFVDSSYPDSKQVHVPIYCWVAAITAGLTETESFPIVGWRSSGLNARPSVP